MEIKLKQKHRSRKPTQQGYTINKGGGNSGTPKKRVPGPKTYEYGSRVMRVDALRGTKRMVAG